MVTRHTTRASLEERRDLALRDLVDLDEQEAAGEIPAARALQLRQRYEADAARAFDLLDEFDRVDQDPEAGSDPDVRARTETESWPTPAAGGAMVGGRRRIAGVVLVVAVIATVALSVRGDLTSRPTGGFVTGNEATGGRDLSEVTNAEMEEVIAANPDIVAMRLRLAHRYFEDGDYDRAVKHYLAVLDREPAPEAMAHLGWLVFLDGEVEVAADLLVASRDRDPDDAEALWFLANVRLYGQQDPAAAKPLLQELLSRGGLGSGRAEVEQALADAKELLEGQGRDTGGDADGS